MKEEKKLHRSISDLINEHEEQMDGENIIELDIDLISPNPYQPRRIFEDEKIEELSNSIKEHGVFQPIIVKKIDDKYIIVAGERRYRATKKAGLKTIPVINRAYQQEKIVEIALLENLQRENLTAIEEAYAYVNMMKHLRLTQQDLAIRMSKSRSHITNVIGLLELPNKVQDMILNKQISMGHARALSKLQDGKKIENLANKIINEDLSVRHTESMTQGLVKKNQINRKAKPIIFSQYEKKITNKYDVKTKVTDNKVVIEYKNAEQLTLIMDKLING